MREQRLRLIEVLSAEILRFTARGMSNEEIDRHRRQHLGRPRLAVYGPSSGTPSVSLSSPRTRARTSRPSPIEGPPINSHDRAIPIRKQTTTSTAIVLTAPA
jgi:hypothetical protein